MYDDFSFFVLSFVYAGLGTFFGTFFWFFKVRRILLKTNRSFIVELKQSYFVDLREIIVYFWGIGKKRKTQEIWCSGFYPLRSLGGIFFGEQEKKRKTQELWCSGFYRLRSLGGKSQVFSRVGFSLIFNLTISSYIFVYAYLCKFV